MFALLLLVEDFFVVIFAGDFFFAPPLLVYFISVLLTLFIERQRQGTNGSIHTTTQCMSQHQQQLEAARTTHKHTCLLLPLCSLCRAHVAKTKVRMWLGVSSMCHAGTNKQHSIARGGGGGGAATRTVTHPPPLSHQHKQAATSLHLVARGRWCGCVKHASSSPSPPTPTHT